MEKQLSINQSLNHLPIALTAATVHRQTFAPHVLIFKTNIQTPGVKFYIGRFLNKHPLIVQWNIDLEDVDCVLRVVANHLQHQDIIELLGKRGYYCEELV